jgi:uncharacterized PurR-regulated membrane protein YhhQ (DUF165 family)
MFSRHKKVSEFMQTSVLKVKPQYLTFLAMLYVTLTLIGCPVLYKIVKIGFINAPGGLLPLPLVLLLEDVIAEVYGYQVSRVLLWYLLGSMLLFIYSEYFIVHLPSPSYWNGESLYKSIFDPLVNGVPIMVVGIFCGRFCNLFTIVNLKIITKGRYFWARSVISCLFGDVVALLIIYGLAFWSSPFHIKLHLFMSDLVVRVAYSIIGGFLGVFIVSWLKKAECIDVYDYYTKFNPFSFNISSSIGSGGSNTKI